MSADPFALLGYKVDQLGLSVERIGRWRDDTAQELAAREVEYHTLKDEVAALREDVKGLRRVLIGLACTIAGSSVIFGLSIMAATGKVF